MSTHDGRGSGGVLQGFWDQVAVDEYATIAPGPERNLRSLSGRRHLPAALALLAIGLLVTVAVLSARGSDEQRQATRVALEDRIAALDASISRTQAESEQRSAVVDELRGRLVDEGTTAQARLEDDTLAAGAAATAMTGPGVTVTVDDAPGAQPGSLDRVLDRDLQDIVNTLWQMGATGIAVNDHRLTSATAIRGAGEAILVDYQPITRPYVVTALGTTAAPGESSPLDRLLEVLSTDYGLVSDVAVGDVALPAGEVRAPRFATPQPTGGPS